MPFDNATYKPLDRTRLAELAQALRHPLPEDFAWDMGYVYEDASSYRMQARMDPQGHRRLSEGWCGSVGCAIGLAMTLWPDFLPLAKDEIYNYPKLATFIDMPPDVAHDTFFSDAQYGGDFNKVRPEQVADAIDEYLNGSERLVPDSGG